MLISAESACLLVFTISLACSTHVPTVYPITSTSLYELTVESLPCKNSSVSVVVLNGASGSSYESLRSTASVYLSRHDLEQEASSHASMVALSSDTDLLKPVPILRFEANENRFNEAASRKISFPSTGNWYVFSNQDDSVVTLSALSGSSFRTHSRRSSDEESCDCNCDSNKHMWIGIILGVGFFGMLPILFKQFGESQMVMMLMSLFNCFGGGALFTVAITHIFPEALELYPAEDSDDYPAAAMLVPAGYLVLLVFDKVLVSLCKEQSESSPGEDVANPTNEEYKDAIQEKVVVEIPENDDSAPGSGRGHSTGSDDGISAGPSQSKGVISAGPSQSKGVILAIGIFAAMTIHSVLAGFALGLACDSSDVEALGTAIVCHKLFDVSSLGIVLVRQHTPLCKAFPMVLVVALMTPIGAWAGMAGDNVDNKVNGALQALAAGTFIYVGVQEVLAHEFRERKHVVLKALSCCLGMGLIGLVALAKEPEEH
jgi:zinc transporter ZupT